MSVSGRSRVTAAVDTAAKGYRGKVVERERARALRADAWTLEDIAAELGVAKSSVSLWVRDVAFEPQPRRAGRRRAPNRLQVAKQAQIDEAHAAGRRRVGALSEQEFLVAGVALYAGEGAKTDGMVLFTNSDPAMVSFFCAWLRHFFDIDESRLRVRLYLHDGLDLDDAVNHWVDVTGIESTKFLKPYRATADATLRRTKHVNGIVGVQYTCSKTHRLVMGLVRALLTCGPLPSGVAQLAEQRTVNPFVVGSSPTPGASTSRS